MKSKHERYHRKEATERTKRGQQDEKQGTGCEDDEVVGGEMGR